MPRPEPLPIDMLFQIKATCEDCGRRHVWDRHRIAKEQLRRGLATPEELGSCFACSHCRERGSDGKNVSVRLVSRSGVVTPVIRDLRPLSSLDHMSAECPHCGHAARFGTEQLAAYPSTLTVHDIWLRAVCGHCKAAGSPSPRMTIEVTPPMRRPGKPEAKVKWSTAPIRWGDRSNPFPNLSRRLVAAE